MRRRQVGSTVFEALVTVLAVGLFVALCIGLWKLGRTIHYSLAYEAKVTATIEEMVKEDCLR